MLTLTITLTLGTITQQTKTKMKMRRLHTQTAIGRLALVLCARATTAPRIFAGTNKWAPGVAVGRSARSGKDVDATLSTAKISCCSDTSRLLLESNSEGAVVGCPVDVASMLLSLFRKLGKYPRKIGLRVFLS